MRSAAVQQDDAVIARQPEHDVERMDGTLDELRHLIAEVLAQPELQVDQAIVIVEQRPGLRLQAQAAEQRRYPPAKDRDACPAIRMICIGEFDRREQHGLMRRRPAGGVVQRHVAAVGHKMVDEAQLARLQHQRAVPPSSA